MLTGSLTASQKSWLPLARTPGRRFVLIWTAHFLVLVTLGGLIAWLLFKDYRQIDGTERDRLVNQTAVIEKNLQPQMQMADRVIERVLERLPAWQAQGDHLRRGNDELRVMNDTLLAVRPILVVGEDGVVAASSAPALVGRRLDIRRAFDDLARDPDPGALHIAPPTLAAPGAGVVNLYRRIRRPDGAFGGLVMVGVEPDYFEVLLESVRYAADMSTSIVKANGEPILSLVDVGAPARQRPDLSTFLDRHRRGQQAIDVFAGPPRGSADGRVVALRTLRLARPIAGQPLVIEASRDLDAVFSPWRRGVYTQSGLFTLVSMLSTCGLWLIQRRRRAEAQEQHRHDDRIRKLAYFDHLTGLPNRVLLKERLQQAMAGSAAQRQRGALLFIDLDDFQTLNDTFGHPVGDQLLRQVSERLCALLPGADTVARMGGDEFVVILSGLGPDDCAATAAAQAAGAQILAGPSQAFELGTLAHTTSSSIGAVLFAGEAIVASDLLKQADLAMYRAKADGRGCLRFFDPPMAVHMAERAAFEADLRAAVRQRQFVLHYQAQVGGDGRVTGAEALLRWDHAARGLVSPAEFIALAEETGLIHPLGQWVLHTACTQLAVWSRRPETCHLNIAVNVSAHQFNQADFVERVIATLEETGASPHRLKLELTESLLVANVTQVADKMAALKRRGIGFALDDFGTGYSSLAYLKRLPLDQLKIDRSFIRDVLTDANDATIAKTIIALADHLHLDVIAEGVESAAQREFLAQAGCCAYQGYLFGRPVPAAEFLLSLGPHRAVGT